MLKCSVQWQRSPHKTEGQGFPFEIFHYQILKSILRTDIMDRANMGMIQRSNGSRLALKPLLPLWIEAKMGRQDFDCDYPVQARVSSTVHLTHATRTQRRLDLIGPQLCSRSQTHTWNAL